MQEIAALLKARGIKTWLDKEQIVGGDQWQKKMAEGLRESKSTLVFISDNGFGAWHSEESQYALSIVAGGQTKRRIIPVLLPPLTGIPDEDDTAFLKTRHAITFSSPDDEGAVEDLVNGIRAQRHLYRFHLSILRLFRSEARRDLDEFLSYRGGRQPGCPVPPNDILAACPYDS